MASVSFYNDYKRWSLSYLSDVSLNNVMILLEYVSIYKLVLFGGLEVHAVLVAEGLLRLLKVLVKEDFL